MIHHIYQDHCCSDIPKLDIIDFAVLSESNFILPAESDYIKLVYYVITQPLESPNSVKSAKKAESNPIESHTNCQEETSYPRFWDTYVTMATYDSMFEPYSFAFQI